ncbi:MAG: hypothetical protein ABIE94_04915 [archaeon]
MLKRGQGISVNVIIIAAIALLVLIILAVLILRSGGQVSDGTGCRGIGGDCKSECLSGTEINNIAQAGERGGCLADQKCCVRLGTAPTE